MNKQIGLRSGTPTYDRAVFECGATIWLRGARQSGWEQCRSKGMMPALISFFLLFFRPSTFQGRS